MDLMSKNNNPKTAIIGGGAAGFFLAINLKELSPEMDVTIFERSRHPLAKVEISGGGRCNCTNSFEGIKDLKSVYPRGHRLMKRLFHGFNHQDAYEWFERHGVKLMTQSDHCVFPEVQDSHAIINMFMHEIHRHNIKLEIGKGINSLDLLGDYDYIVVTTGGTPRIEPYQWLKDLGHTIELPVPSLFSLSIADPNLNKLMGIVCENAVVHLEGTKYREQGTLLITHWGVSGPAVLRLSSHAARYLHDVNYKSSLCVIWTGKLEAEVRQSLMEMAISHPNKVVRGNTMFGISQRLWDYLTAKSLGNQPSIRWCELGKKHANKLISTLVNDVLPIKGRAPFKDEFVTCGGISLKDIDQNTLESKVRPNMFFAGEVLDIDGITGGFNFQAAWTTAYNVATTIAKRANANF